MDDKTYIKIANRLDEEGHISKKELSFLKIKNGKVFDNCNFIVDICDNGTVHIHNRGSYPIILENNKGE